MGHRKFVDEKGIWWQVWEVLPDDAEHRLRERRQVHTPPKGRDNRGLVDRRRRASFRSTVPPELANGWLAFQSLAQKRRYWPIPAGWQALPDSELRVLCREAHEVVSRVPNHFDTGEMGGAAPPAV